MSEFYQFVYRVRGLLMIPPCAVLVFVRLRETEWDTVLWSVGLLIFLAGVGLRVWAQMHLHYRLHIHKKLTTTGPYAHVRNPIYIANTAMLIGLTVISELLWFLPVMLAWCAVVYTFVVRREEAHLLEKYGRPYADFLASTPRWLPRLHGRDTGPIRVRQFLWGSVVAELHCFLWLLPLILKELWF